ncbi:MAG: hypothetical protein EZS28_011134 [Streblomastix strix]|uniref:Uncharacterized protein n=1 Tax=Streblomastix strix TaxID=222440 RepID=A0A5J4WFQ6_9EUKA|nr:MAG: hypothetical protein EZS28_011134 [Streblomastix strix]
MTATVNTYRTANQILTHVIFDKDEVEEVQIITRLKRKRIPQKTAAELIRENRKRSRLANEDDYLKESSDESDDLNAAENQDPGSHFLENGGHSPRFVHFPQNSGPTPSAAYPACISPNEFQRY